jgi:mannose-6-phosphate isomerase-like protein (cupin superfamily)
MPKLAADDKNKVFPDWSETQNYGVSYTKAGGEVEPHFHDCHEYWIIISGRGVAMSEGNTFELGPGDMLLTKAGDYHSLRVTEDMVAVYYYGVMPEHGRWGHLHEGQDLPRDEYLKTLKQTEQL